MEYEYVKVKQYTHPLVLLRNLKLRFYGNPFQFVWNFIYYHILIIISSFVFGMQVPSKVMMPFDMGDVAFVGREMAAIASLDIASRETVIMNLLFLFAILFFDLFLLLIIKSEVGGINIPYIGIDVNSEGVDEHSIKKYWFKLTYSRIGIIEVVLFLLGSLSPVLRVSLLFFGINTFQIAVAQKFVIKKWKGFYYFFVTGSYIFLLSLIAFDINHIVSLIWR